MANNTENEMEPLFASSSDENELSKDTDGGEEKKIMIDIEPVVFIYTLYFGASTLFAEQYIYRNVSQQNNFASYNLNSCKNQTLFNIADKNLLEKTQKESSYVMLVLTVSTTFPSMLSTLFIGPYVDNFGRKFGILLPIAGAIFKCTVYTIVIFAGINYWFLMIGCIIEGFTGFIATFFMASFAYSSDVSAAENRTRKITVVEVCCFLAITVGLLTTGPIIENVGYTYPFIFLALLLTLALVYALVILQETINKTDYNYKPILRNLCKLENIKMCVKVFTTNNHCNRRPKLWLNLVVFIIVVPLSIARWDAQTYFLKGKPLCFSSYQVGFFSGGMMFLAGLGSLWIVFCCGHRLGDLRMLVVGVISGIFQMVLFAFVTSIQLLILVPIVGMFSTMTTPLVRSMCSKLVGKNEQGSMFAGLAFTEAAGHMLGILMFNSVFSASVHVMPGFVFLIMAGAYVIALILALSQKCIPDTL